MSRAKEKLLVHLASDPDGMPWQELWCVCGGTLAAFGSRVRALIRRGWVRNRPDRHGWVQVTPAGVVEAREHGTQMFFTDAELNAIGGL